jgi:hypothetical protein
MFYLSAGFRTLPAILICIALIGCGAPPGVAPSASSPGPSGGSVRVDSATPPAGQPREFTFSGAVTGTNQVSRQACESSGKTYRHFTLTTDGNVAGRNYFLMISVYPYMGPGAYELRPLPGRPLTHDVSPNPLFDEASGIGFLNFVPKYRPGYAYSQATRPPYSTMAVDAGAGSGWIDAQWVSLNQAGEPLSLRVSGRFVCGPAFTPFPEMSPPR